MALECGGMTRKTFLSGSRRIVIAGGAFWKGHPFIRCLICRGASCINTWPPSRKSMIAGIDQSRAMSICLRHLTFFYGGG